MYGSNYYGQAYYGQGPAVGTTFILKSVTGVAIALATLSTKVFLNKTLNATVVTVATVQRLLAKTLTTAVVVALADAAGAIFEALNIRRTSTKFLNMSRHTRGLEGFDNSTTGLNLDKTTRIITDY